MAEERVMIEMEYLLNTTPGILFNRLSTASGLSEWFANDVGVEGKVYTFKWEGSTQRAEQTLRKDNKLVRFNWLDEDLEGAWFEFRSEERRVGKECRCRWVAYRDKEEN